MRLLAKFFVVALSSTLFLPGCSPPAPTADSGTDPATVAEAGSAADGDGLETSNQATDDGLASDAPIEGEKEDLVDAEPSLNPPKRGDAAVPGGNTNAGGESDGHVIVVGEDDGIKFMATKNWNVAKRRNRIVEFEMAIPKVEADDAELPDGRLTIMGAMGSVEANIDRWYKQFEQPDGGSTADVSKETKLDVNGNEVMIVDIAGTYLDMPGGPMAGGKTIKRENYRMLSAIIQAGTYGQYFVKFYGSAKTVNANEEAFLEMINSLQVGE